MDEKYLEQASRLEQTMRDHSLQRAHDQVSGTGQADCVGCDAPISPERRAALPSATRCIPCQQNFERRKGRQL